MVWYGKDNEELHGYNCCQSIIEIDTFYPLVLNTVGLLSIMTLYKVYLSNVKFDRNCSQNDSNTEILLNITIIIDTAI